MKTFALRNYSGTEMEYYSVDAGTVTGKIKPALPVATHHIVIVDCSGSMCNLMSGLRNCIVDSLGSIEEQPHIKVSLLSYASEGDVRLHFEREPLEKVNKKGSIPQRSIQSLSTRGLTCISQALEHAQTLIRDGEPTAVTLHSDGYANDDSSYSERRELEDILPEFKNARVPIHTVSHSSYSDFQTLNRIANETGGRCTFARETSEIEKPLKETTISLGGGLVSVPVKLGDADLVVVVDPTYRRVVSAKTDLLVLQVSDPKALSIYRYKQINKSGYMRGTQIDTATDAADKVPIYAFSLAQLALGGLNQSKFALVSTRNQTVLNDHFQALVNEDLAAYSEALKTEIFSQTDSNYSEEYGLKQMGMDLLTLSVLLHTLRDSITVDVDHLRSVYTYRGLKKIRGYRDSTGKHIAPDYVTVPQTADPFQAITSVEINKNNANINMTVTQRVNLCENTAKQKVISSVSGVRLNELVEYRAFTLVGDGRLNVPELKLKFSSKTAFNALKYSGVLTGSFDEEESYLLQLSELPLVPLDLTFTNLKNTFELAAGGRLLILILRAMFKGTSSTLSREQIKALRGYGVSASLNVNIRSCNAVEDLEAAMERGEVDRRPTFNIDIGTTTIQNIKDFRSTTQILQTFYKVDGKSKSKWPEAWDPKSDITKKKLSKRTKVTTADEFSIKLVDQLLGLAPLGSLKALLTAFDAKEHETTLETLAERSYNPASFRSEVEDMIGAIEDGLESLYAKQICPIVFYIGCTGLIPSEYNAVRHDADALLAKYPHLKIDRDEREGSFFVFEDDIISVYIEDDWVSLT